MRVWVAGTAVSDVRFHMGKDTFLGLDNYTGLSQGLVAQKTNTETQNRVYLLVRDKQRSPLSNLKAFFIPLITPSHNGAAAFETCCLRAKTQQQHILHSVGQELQYIQKHMVVFHGFDSESEQLSGETTCNMLTENIQQLGGAGCIAAY